MENAKKLLVLIGGVIVVLIMVQILQLTSKKGSAMSPVTTLDERQEEPRHFQDERPSNWSELKPEKSEESAGTIDVVESDDEVNGAEPEEELQAITNTDSAASLAAKIETETPDSEAAWTPVENVSAAETVVEESVASAPDPVVTGGVPPFGNPNKIFVSAARKIVPAVVSINSIRRVKGSRFDFFHPFFSPKEEDEDEDKDEDDDEIIQPGSGSGIIISKDGYILTNHHVIEDAEEVRVLLHDKREFKARIVGSDPTTDVAALKIDAGNLVAAQIGNSDQVEIGEWVMAVGNPLEFTSTVTAGIVSAMGRDIRIIRNRYRIENFIQTDAVINPGNSGGALVNLNGEVIGVNTAIATRNGYYHGYGFAIPINLANKVVRDLMQHGRVRRALLGISIGEVNDRTARGVGLDKPMGALVQSVERGFPAERAGLRQGDIILKVDGEEVTSVNDLQTKVAQHQPGESVVLVVWRDSREWEVKVDLAEAPHEDNRTAANETREKLEFKNLGVSLRELTDSEKEAFEVEGGLFVTRVAPESPTERAGMFPRALLRTIDGVDINSVADFEKKLSEAGPGDILKMKIRIQNGDGELLERVLFVEVP